MEAVVKQQDVHICPLNLSDKETQTKVDQWLAPLRLTAEQIQRIRKVFEEEMELGLRKEFKDPSHEGSLQMENTYVPELLDGTEEGEFLALDLGGTNFRVIRILMEKGQMVEEKVQYYTVPEDVRLGKGEVLFDFLADCVHDFCVKKELLHKKLPLGFTFSFPMTQKALNIGILVNWTKSFNCSGVIGEDAVKMLNDALHRRGDIQVDVVAVLNDTTGTIVQGAYQDKNCTIGMILGTGSNAAYIERVENIPKWKGDHHGAKEVVIDIEWGAFGDNGCLDFIKTEYDKQVDLSSLLVHSFTYEKYFGGKYLGELVRVILMKLCAEGLVFNGKPSDVLSKHGGFTTTNVSKVEEDNKNGTESNTREVLKELKLDYSNDDVKVLKYICSVVSDRAAILVAVVTASLLDRMSRPENTVAIDGSLYRLHPRLETFLYTYIGLMAPKQKFKLMLAEDGSGKGAALIAAIGARIAAK